MPEKDNRGKILTLLKDKSSLKQDVFHTTIEVFNDFKTVMKELILDLRAEALKIDKRITIDYIDKSEYEIHLKVAGDVLIFSMHTNVFEFDKSHPITKTSYIKRNINNSYCGVINVYNFLADSFKYNRINDVGYLIGRIFINKELHYYVEGKRQIGLNHNDFVNAQIDKTAIKDIIESLILYCIEFDLFTPPFDNVAQISVAEIQEATNNVLIKTGKRLGFQFQAEEERLK
jgi:hypothetical protein